MIGDNVRYLRKKKGYSQSQLARNLGINQASVSLWESGKTNPDTDMLLQLARVFGVGLDDLVSDEPRRELDGINIRRKAVPIVGDIACGTPITAEENIDGYADLPDGIHADFALRCVGDSMQPTFRDGDLVLIRQQPTVDTGQIAAVTIDGEATLKRVYQQPDGLLLIAENAKYAPIFVPKDSGKEIIIHGKAIGYTRLFD